MEQLAGGAGGDRHKTLKTEKNEKFNKREIKNKSFKIKKISQKQILKFLAFVTIFKLGMVGNSAEKQKNSVDFFAKQILKQIDYQENYQSSPLVSSVFPTSSPPVSSVVFKA